MKIWSADNTDQKIHMDNVVCLIKDRVSLENDGYFEFWYTFNGLFEIDFLYLKNFLL